MTPRQLQIYEFLRVQIAETGICPSFQQIADHCGLSGKSSVYRVVESLEEQGLITRQKSRARRIIINPPGQVSSFLALSKVSTNLLKREIESRGFAVVAIKRLLGVAAR